MSKENAIFIGIVVVIIIILVCVIKNNNKNESLIPNPAVSYGDEYQTLSESITSEFNEENKTYDIIDSVTGEVIKSVEDEELLKAELDFYKTNPTYRADPPFELE